MSLASKLIIKLWVVAFIAIIFVWIVSSAHVLQPVHSSLTIQSSGNADPRDVAGSSLIQPAQGLEALNSTGSVVVQ